MAARGKPFQTGSSGNPKGRPKGARNRSAVALDAILEDAGEDIARKAVEMAKAGDAVALRLCLERLCPPRRDRPVSFALPEILTTADLPKATNALLQAVAAGTLTPSEASDLGKAVDAHVRAIEATDLHERLSRLEAAAS